MGQGTEGPTAEMVGPQVCPRIVRRRTDDSADCSPPTPTCSCRHR